MNRRILSLILAICLLLPLVPTARAEETEPTIEELVAEQLDAFIATLNPEGASEGASQLVKHSVKGGGDLKMTEKDKFGKALFSTKLFRESFIAGITDMHNAVKASLTQECYLISEYGWYEARSSFDTDCYLDDGNGNAEDDVQIPQNKRQWRYFGPYNTYDQAMMLVAGWVDGRWNVEKTEVTADTITYKIDICLYDRFDFDGEYTGTAVDHDLEEFLTWAGKLLSLGLLREFNWELTTTLEITLPNSCAHQTSSYRWEFDGEGLAVAEDEGLTVNPLIQHEYWNGTGESSVEDGIFYYIVYSFNEPVRLSHDRPWTIEWVSKGTGNLTWASGAYETQGPYLRLGYNSLIFGNAVPSEESESGYIHHGYGHRLYPGANGISTAEQNTYTLTNRIFEDGSNMVYLTVNGQEIGPMSNHYFDGNTDDEPDNWVSGKDFLFQFLGNQKRPIRHLSIDYVAVWENGIDSEPYSYLTTAHVSPDCDSDGGTLNVCSLCGAEFLTDVIPATGHDFTDWKTVKEPTCAAEGKMERSCRTCGHKETRTIARPDHAYESTVTQPTCTEGGFTVYTCNCGDSYITDHTDALGHDMTQWTTVMEPTCTESGTEERWCQRCDHRESRTADPLGHHYEEIIIEPQCTVGGYTLHQCVCGDSYKSDFTSPRGHRYEGIETPPTCTESGYTTYLCDCGDSYKSNYTGPRGHSYEGIVTVPTCTESGYTTYLCACGDSYISNYVGALGHEYEAGKCTRCGEAEPGYVKPNPFTDVPEGSFYLEPVLWAVENGITTGATADSFNPNGACLRAQVVTFLHRAAENPEPSSDSNPFTDVKSSDFFYAPVLWAVETGITNGVSATEFGSYANCNRAAVVTFLWRAAGSPEPESNDNPFTDVKESDFFYKSVLWAVEKGITNGISPTEFGPAAECNRAQVVTFLYRAYH